MGVVLRQGSQTTISSFVGVIIGYVNVLWLLPAILDPDQIGLIRLLPSIAYLLLPFSQLGLAQGTVKFFPTFNVSKEGRGELLSFMLIVNVISFGITLLILKIFEEELLNFFQEKSRWVNDYFYVSIIFLFLFSLTAILESFSKSILKIVVPSVIRDVVVRLLNSSLLALLFFQIISFHQFVHALIGVYVVGLLLLFGYLMKKGLTNFQVTFTVLNFSLVKRILGYGLFMILGSAGGYAILHIDQIMISKMIGLEANAIYTTAFYIAVVIELPRKAVGQISLPLISRAFEADDLLSINKLYKQVSVNQMIVGTLLLIGIIVNVDSVFQLIPNNAIYKTGLNVVFIIGLAKLIDMIFSINSEIILMSEYYRYNVLFSFLIGIFCVLLNWIFIRQMGIDGAALATGSCLLFFNVVKLVFLKIKLNLWPFTWSNLYVGIVGLSVFLIIQQIPFMGSLLLDIIVRSILTTVIFGLPILYLKLSPEINEVVYRIIDFRLR